MSAEVKHYLLEKLREEFEIACVRAGLASLVLLALFQWPLFEYFGQDTINLAASTALVFFQGLRVSLGWLKTVRTEIWLKIHSFIIGLISCTWSVILFNVTMSPIARTELHIFTHLVFAGLVCSSAFTLSISRRNFYAFTFPILLSQTVAFALFTSAMSYKISILAIMTMFFLFLLKQRSRFEENWKTALTKNYELQKIIDAMPGGVIVIHAGVYSLINKTISQIFQGVGNLKGQTVQKFTNMDQALKLNEEVKKFSSSSASETQFEIELKIGNKKQTHLVNAIKISEVEIMISTLDISDRKRTEEEINSHKAQLFKNAKMVLLGEMSESLAHEINNAMATILLKTQQLQLLAESSDHVSSGVINANLQSIEPKISHVTKVVKSLRNISKGTTTSPKSRVVLADVVASALNLCRLKFESEGVSVVDEVDRTVELDCIPSQISQVVLSALYNSFEAIQKLDEKWIKIYVRQQNEKIQLIILDSGKGIPENIRDKVMLPFFSSKGTNSSTGLGLSLSQDIIEAHNGALYFNYENKKHTELVIELPHKIG